jgi:hypothetical protein
MSQDHKPIQVEFAPGCFDDFEGTQEELDSMIKELTLMLQTQTLEELEEQGFNVCCVDESDLSDYLQHRAPRMLQ